MGKYKWLIINNINGCIINVYTSWAEANRKLAALQSQGWDVRLEPKLTQEKV